MRQKMREKDLNFQKILEYLQDGRDPHGFAQALRNEKLLVKVQLERIGFLERDLRNRNAELGELKQALKDTRLAKVCVE